MSQKMSNKRKHHAHTKKAYLLASRACCCVSWFPQDFLFRKKSCVKPHYYKMFQSFLIVGSIHYSSMFHKCRHWHWNNTQQRNEGKQNLNVMWFQCLHVSSTCTCRAVIQRFQHTGKQISQQTTGSYILPASSVGFLLFDGVRYILVAYICILLAKNIFPFERSRFTRCYL